MINIFYNLFLKYEHCDTVATDVLRALEEFVDLDYTEDVYGKFLLSYTVITGCFRSQQRATKLK